MLLDILNDITAEDGIKTEQRNLAIKRINDAAKEIYDMGDLYGLIRAEVFDLNQGASQVALPEYVGHVRGMRYYDTRLRISLENLGNRFKDGCNDCWYLKFNELERQPLCRNISNQSTLSFSLPLPETEALQIYIQGPTNNSARAYETVNIAAGILTAESTGNYRSPLWSIRKNIATRYDLTIKDAEENILAVIPNYQLESRYHIYQIMDTQYTQFSGDGYAVETLFKKRFIPFKNDTDEFVGGSDYDKAIVWKYLENQASDVKAALALRVKCNDVVKNINDDAKTGKRERIEFVPGPFLNMSYGQIRYF
jgi:hypothetical protein